MCLMEKRSLSIAMLAEEGIRVSMLTKKAIEWLEVRFDQFWWLEVETGKCMQCVVDQYSVRTAELSMRVKQNGHIDSVS
ncbi:hypothetical protein L1887_07422 [Cichorium endivia]|nr:hypothetical protein L1887_07422 [Cichorium endivia]